MISAEEARQFAEKHFPEAPEKLAAEQNVLIRESPLDGCDGWCLTVDDRSIIRITSNQTSGRKRLTLTHELAHLILGIPSVVGESYEDMLSSDSALIYRLSPQSVAFWRLRSRGEFTLRKTCQVSPRNQ